jgi:predicted RNA-binding Zn-ribbon protein involved in translation (DUF1610 family)
VSRTLPFRLLRAARATPFRRVKPPYSGRSRTQTPLSIAPRHGRIGRPEGDTGQNGKECAMSASGCRQTHVLLTAKDVNALLSCPSCGSAHVAQVLGDNGGVSYVCTSCGHSWSD